MKIVEVNELDRDVVCPNGGFVSSRILLKSDGMGYSLTKIFIPKGTWQHWHYKNHLESCYCLSGHGLLKETDTGKIHTITADTVYILDKHDEHEFKALVDTYLICIFNPPLIGKEIHQKDGSYEVAQ